MLGYDAPELQAGGVSAPAMPEDGTSNVVMERTPVEADDTDALTTRTVEKMCEYINQSAGDPFITQQIAPYCLNVMGRGNPAFGVFMFLKHKIRRVLDEGLGMRLNEASAADILISPSVLLRMTNPQGDCDDFTMAAAAILRAIGCEVCIVTVACDGREPSRWSHVFLMVKTPAGDWLPLDCSHGKYVGWFVPDQQLFRWQAWSLDGKAIDAQPPVRSRLHQYIKGPMHARRRRGMGQTDACSDPTSADCAASLSSSVGLPTTAWPGVDSSYPVVLDSTGATSSSSLSSNQIASLITQGLTDATKVAQVAELPMGASLTNTGAVIGSSIQSFLPILLLGIGAIVLLGALEGGHK